jgi:hypothetical protein
MATAGCRLSRDVRSQTGVELAGCGQVAAVRLVRLLLPAPYLTAEEPVRLPEAGQAGRGRIDGMEG